MKKTGDIVDLPIIDISLGDQVGKVKDILVNAEKGSVEYVIVESEKNDPVADVIFTKDILGIGEFALTIESKNVVKEINQVSDALTLLQKNIRVKNMRILTKKGDLIGQTGDFFVDENNSCKIVALEFLKNDEDTPSGILSAETVVTYGRNLIIVNTDAMEYLKQSIDGFQDSRESLKQIEDSNDFSLDTQEDQIKDYININENKEVEDKIDEIGQEIFEDEIVPDEEDSTNAAELFEIRQRQYLVGRRATKTIVDNQGKTIVEKGMIINNVIIDEAKDKEKLIELVMNNKG